MVAVVIPNAKNPIRGILATPIKESMELDLSEMQIKRILNNSGSVYVKSVDGIRKEITLNKDGSLNIDAISDALEDVNKKEEVQQTEKQEPVEGFMNEPVEPEAKEEVEQTEKVVEEPKQDYSYMTKAQRRAARKEEQRKMAEESNTDSENNDEVKEKETTEE